MDEKWQQLKDWINESDNIVFFGGAVFLRKAAYRISAVWTDCIIRNISTRRSGSSVTAFTYKIRKSSTASIKTVCCFRMQNLMQPIKPLQNWNRKEN